MNVTRIEGLKEALNNDPEFQLVARFWNAGLRLGIGDAAYWISINGGRVAEVKSWDEVVPATTSWNIGQWGAPFISISAPAEDWRKACDPVPKPYYHELHAAWRHHDFEVGGDMENFYQYSPAIRRIFHISVALMRDA